MSPSALITFTCTMPTSFRLERERSRRCGGREAHTCTPELQSFSLDEKLHFSPSSFQAAEPYNINRLWTASGTSKSTQKCVKEGVYLGKKWKCFVLLKWKKFSLLSTPQFFFQLQRNQNCQEEQQLRPVSHYWMLTPLITITSVIFNIFIVPCAVIVLNSERKAAVL